MVDRRKLDIRSSKSADQSANASVADEGKLNGPDETLSSKQSNHSGTTEVISGKNGEEGMLSAKLNDSKDSLASVNYMPFSPQWLYAKPAEPKMEIRRQSSIGNPTDNNQKGSQGSQGTENKKDRRLVRADNEYNRCWHEEERETSSASGRRDRWKPEWRGNRDNAPARKAVQNRALPNSKHRWHETKTDTKCSSSRWSSNEMEDLSSQAEKKPDVEKEEAHTKSQTSVVSNCPPSGHDVDSRDKWRPRHRMEFRSGGPMATNPAARGFGGEKLRVEGLNLGFADGKGRVNVSGQTSSLGSTEISEIIPGKPRHSSDVFCYPRRKILDLYRLKNLEPAFSTMPKDMEKSHPLTEVDRVEPLAFVAPDADEQVVLSSIWKGKITSSGVASNSHDKRRATKNASGNGLESMDGIVDILPSMVVEETKETAKDVKIDENILSGSGTHINMMDGKDVNNSEMRDYKITFENGLNGSIPGVPENNDISSSKVENGCADHVVFQPEADTLVMMNQNDSLNGEAKVPENYTLPRNLRFCYVDPQGEIQGPFLGADILSWFEQGFYGMDLPVRLVDAPEGTPFQNLGDMMAYLKDSDGSVENINQPLLPAKFEPFGATELSKAKEPNTAVPEFQSLPTVPGSKHKNLPNFKDQSFNDSFTRDEGRSMDTGHHPVTTSSGNAQDLVASSHLVPEFTESGLRNNAENKSHQLGPLWSELEKAPPKSSRYPDNFGRTASFSGMSNLGIVKDAWNITPGETRPYQDMIASRNFAQENRNLHRAEQLTSQRFEQQQNTLPSFAPLNEQALEQFQNHIINQQMANFSGPKLSHLIAFRMQQLQLLQQEFHQKQKLILQEQQQQKTELGQFLQDRMMRNLVIQRRILEFLRSIHNNNYNNTALGLAILEQCYFNQLQQLHQCRYHPHRHAEPSLGQLVQARFGRTQSLDHHVLPEKKLLQSRQSSVEEKRHSNPLWPNNDRISQSMRAEVSSVLRAPCLDGFEDLPLEKKVELEKYCIRYQFQRCLIPQGEHSTKWMTRSATHRNEDKSKLMDILKLKWARDPIAEVVDSTHIVSAKSVSSHNIPFKNHEKPILEEQECKNVNGVKSGFESKQRAVKQDVFLATGGSTKKLGVSNLFPNEIPTPDRALVSVRGEKNVPARRAPAPVPQAPEKYSSTHAREGDETSLGDKLENSNNSIAVQAVPTDSKFNELKEGKKTKPN